MRSTRPARTAPHDGMAGTRTPPCPFTDRSPVPTRRLVPALLAVVALLAALVGCAIGPSDRPDLAVYGGPASSGTGTSDAGRPTGAGGPGQNAQFEPGWGGCSGLPSFEGRAAEFTMECAAIRVPYDYSQPTAGRLN